MSLVNMAMVTAVIVAVIMRIPAYAAGRTTPDDNTATYLFLGFCALIIVAQVAPLVWQAVRKRAQREMKAETVEQVTKP